MSKNNGQVNLIFAGTTIEGNLKSSGNFNIQGVVKGTIECEASFTLGETGVIDGDVIAGDAMIDGRVTGSIKVKNKISLGGKAHVSGELFCARLTIEDGAVFEGRSSMGDKKSMPLKDELKVKN